MAPVSLLYMTTVAADRWNHIVQWGTMHLTLPGVSDVEDSLAGIDLHGGEGEL